jgi:hypothetical protein
MITVMKDMIDSQDEPITSPRTRRKFSLLKIIGLSVVISVCIGWVIKAMGVKDDS